MANTPIPPQATPVLSQTGAMSDPWYRFQLSLFNASGGSTNDVDDALTLAFMEDGNGTSSANSDEQLAFSFLVDEPSASFVNPPFVNLNKWLFAPSYAVPANGTDQLAGITALIAEANAYATANGGAEVALPGLYSVSGNVNLTSSKVALTGRGSEGGLRAIGGANFTLLTCALGGTVASTTVAANASRGAKTIQLTSAAGFAAGQYVSIENYTGYTVGANDRRGFVTKVASVAAPNITLVDALPFDINSARTSSVIAMTFGEGPDIADIYLDGSAASGTVNALRADRLFTPKFTSIRSNGFASGFGQLYVNFYGGYFQDLQDIGSGLAGDAVDFYLGGGGAHIDGAKSIDSTGFGIGMEYVAYCDFADLEVRRAAQRGLKIYGSCQNKFTRLSSNENGKTGLAVTGGSQYNKFVQVETIGNTEHGIWQNGTDNWFNDYDVIRSQYNNRAAASWVDISAANFNATGVGVDHDMDDRHSAFTNIAPNIDVTTDVASLSNFVSTSITVSRRPYMAFSRKTSFAAKAASALSIANNTLTTVIFGTVDINQNGGYDATTGIFTAVLPGLYQFNARVELSGLWAATGEIHFAINNVLTASASILSGISENGREISMSRYLNAGDTVRVQIKQISGGALTLVTTDYRTSFDGVMV